MRQIEIFPSHTRLHDRVVHMLDMLARCRQNLSKTSHYICEIITIYHEYEGGIEKSVPRITDWHHEACRVMTINDREGRIFLSDPHTNNGFFFMLTT